MKTRCNNFQLSLIFKPLVSMLLAIDLSKESVRHGGTEHGKQMTKGCLVIQKHECISWGSDCENKQDFQVPTVATEDV